MAAPVVFQIISDGMTRQKTPHQFRDSLGTTEYQEVKVIIHQSPGQYFRSGRLHQFTDTRDKILPVLVVKKYRAAFHSSCHHVVKYPRCVQSRLPRHKNLLPQLPKDVKSLFSSTSPLADWGPFHDLALAALDPGSRVETVHLVSGMEELKRRLEVLLGTKPVSPIDESRKAEAEREAERIAMKERVASAGGQLLGAAFALVSAMLPTATETEETRQVAQTLKSRLSECVEKDERGQLRMTITLPEESILDQMARSLAQILGQGLKT